MKTELNLLWRGKKRVKSECNFLGEGKHIGYKKDENPVLRPGMTAFLLTYPSHTSQSFEAAVTVNKFSAT
jgi:hypothetical protein